MACIRTLEAFPARESRALTAISAAHYFSSWIHSADSPAIPIRRSLPFAGVTSRRFVQLGGIIKAKNLFYAGRNSWEGRASKLFRILGRKPPRSFMLIELAEFQRGTRLLMN